MTKTQTSESIKSLYQASQQEEFLHLQAQTESLIQELQALKQNQNTSDQAGDRQDSERQH
jgi:hypothetical protein